MGAGDVFPLVPDFVFEPADQFRTLISEMESGKEQRRSMWSAGLAQFLVRKRFVSTANIQTLRSFFKARKGAYDLFWFDNPDDNQVADEAVGTGNGATAVFDLAKYPAQTGASFTFKVDGAPVSAALSNDNVNFKGKVTFAVPPANGAVITGTYKFYYAVRFLEDILLRALTQFGLYEFEVKLQEVRL